MSILNFGPIMLRAQPIEKIEPYMHCLRLFLSEPWLLLLKTSLYPTITWRHDIMSILDQPCSELDPMEKTNVFLHKFVFEWVYHYYGFKLTRKNHATKSDAWQALRSYKSCKYEVYNAFFHWKRSISCCLGRNLWFPV